MAKSSAQAPPEQPQTLADIDKALQRAADELAKEQGYPCYLMLTDDSIGNPMVSDVYEDLRKRYGESNERLSVVIHNSGGDINSAYNLAHIFRRYGAQELVTVVPRWAKSAATLLACAGDRILMAPPAELGPLDPQIHAEDTDRVEHFSPLHIPAALDLIRGEFQAKNDKFAEALLTLLQRPITLGSYLESLKIGRVYMERLLQTRMLRAESPERISEIANRFASGYADHAYCINRQECQEAGLLADELTGAQLEISWRLYRLFERRRDLASEQRQRAMRERLKKLSPEVLEGLGVSPDLLPTILDAGNGSDEFDDSESRRNGLPREVGI